MTLTLTATSDIVLIDGVRCRRYEGIEMEGFISCNVYVHHLEPMRDDDAEAFTEEIRKRMPEAGEPVPMTLAGVFVKPITTEETE